MNLTKALISLYRHETPGITVAALSAPFGAEVVKQNHLALTWEVVGEAPTNFDVQLDGHTAARAIQGTKYTLDLSQVRPGGHKVTLLANGVHTFFDLNPERMTVRSASPLPVTSTIHITYSPELR